MKWVGLLGLCCLMALAYFHVGCATLSEEQCARQDWKGVGHRDGTQGRLATRIVKHQEACAKYAVTIDKTQYEQGRQEGLKYFCTPTNGLSLGKRGARYRGVCPRNLEAAFLANYRKGKRLYQLNRDIKRISRQIASYEDQMDATVDAIQRREFRRKIRELDSKRRRLERRLTVIEIKG